MQVDHKAEEVLVSRARVPSLTSASLARSSNHIPSVGQAGHPLSDISSTGPTRRTERGVTHPQLLSPEARRPGAKTRSRALPPAGI